LKKIAVIYSDILGGTQSYLITTINKNPTKRDKHDFTCCVWLDM